MRRDAMECEALTTQDALFPRVVYVPYIAAGIKGYICPEHKAVAGTTRNQYSTWQPLCMVPP